MSYKIIEAGIELLDVSGVKKVAMSCTDFHSTGFYGICKKLAYNILKI